MPEKKSLKPVCIYKEEKFENQKFIYNKVFAIEKPKKNKKKLYFYI